MVSRGTVLPISAGDIFGATWLFGLPFHLLWRLGSGFRELLVWHLLHLYLVGSGRGRGAKQHTDPEILDCSGRIPLKWLNTQPSRS